MSLRIPREPERASLADLWHAAWHEAHAAHVPPALLAERSRESFYRRLGPVLDRVRMGWDGDGPTGFCLVTPADGELDQLFLAPRARGSGLASRLLADGERRLAAAGCGEAFLLCLPENARARHFYGREGWREDGIRVSNLKTSHGVFPLPCVVLKKILL